MDSPWKLSLKLIKRSPLPILLLQIPAASTEFAQAIVQWLTHGNQWIGAAILLPYFLIVSTLSTGATFWFVTRPAPIRTILFELAKHLRRLLSAGVLAGLVCGLSLVAFLGPALVLASGMIGQWKDSGFVPMNAVFLLIVIAAAAAPGIYYCTIYYFVPMEVIRDLQAPIMACFTRSKVLAKTQLFRTALVCASLFILSLLALAVESALGDSVARLASQASTKAVIRTACVTSGELVFRALVEVWLAYYYILRRRRLPLE